MDTKQAFLDKYIVYNFYEPKHFDFMKNWSESKIQRFKTHMIKNVCANDELKGIITEIAEYFEKEDEEDEKEQEETTKIDNTNKVVVEWATMDFGTLENPLCGICGCREETGRYNKDGVLREDVICVDCEDCWEYSEDDDCYKKIEKAKRYIGGGYWDDESDEEWCDEHEQVMYRNGMKCGACLDKEQGIENDDEE